MRDAHAYQGHLPDGSSVQAHSAGGLYPYVIYAQQVGDAKAWGYIAPGAPGKLIGSYDDAHAEARLAKISHGAAKDLARRQSFWDAYTKSRHSVLATAEGSLA